jgi:tetratricopeptide (TPR) repeat protein
LLFKAKIKGEIMNKKISLVTIFAFLVIAGCGPAPLVPEKELQAYDVRKVMELGAQNYSGYYYDSALYYYNEVCKIFTNDTSEEMDSRAWAKYEIGYINYMQGKYDEANRYFDEVLSLKLANSAPQILANEMKEKIKRKIAQK